MSALLGTCSPHRTCHACLPATYYVLLLPFLRASAICVCAKSHARCPSTSLVLLFPSLPCAPYTTLTHSHCMSARLDTCSPHRTCHACLPATYYVPLLPFPRASAICVCAKSHARCPSTSFVLLFPSLPYAPYTTFPHALTLSPLLNVGRGPAPWPDKQLCVAVSSSCRCFKHSCLRHTWRPSQTSSLA